MVFDFATVRASGQVHTRLHPCLVLIISNTLRVQRPTSVGLGLSGSHEPTPSINAIGFSKRRTQCFWALVTPPRVSTASLSPRIDAKSPAFTSMIICSVSTGGELALALLGRGVGAGNATRGPVRAGRVVRRASCVVRRASCVVRRASCVVRRASCVVRRASRPHGTTSQASGVFPPTSLSAESP